MRFHLFGQSLFRWHPSFTNLPDKKRNVPPIRKWRVIGSIMFSTRGAGVDFITGAPSKFKA
jgi:hypothetical protein